jgi:hypothetical protein
VDYADWKHATCRFRLVRHDDLPGFIVCNGCGMMFLRPKLPMGNTGRRTFARAAGPFRRWLQFKHRIP